MSGSSSVSKENTQYDSEGKAKTLDQVLEQTKKAPTELIEKTISESDRKRLTSSGFYFSVVEETERIILYCLQAWFKFSKLAQEAGMKYSEDDNKTDIRISADFLENERMFPHIRTVSIPVTGTELGLGAYKGRETYQDEKGKKYDYFIVGGFFDFIVNIACAAQKPNQCKVVADLVGLSLAYPLRTMLAAKAINVLPNTFRINGITSKILVGSKQPYFEITLSVGAKTEWEQFFLVDAQEIKSLGMSVPSC